VQPEVQVGGVRHVQTQLTRLERLDISRDGGPNLENASVNRTHRMSRALLAALVLLPRLEYLNIGGMLFDREAASLPYGSPALRLPRRA
jgi:hypothetical protein